MGEDSFGSMNTMRAGGVPARDVPEFDRRIIMAQFALSKKLSKIPEALVGDSELKALYDEAKDKSQMAENALKAGMKDAAIGFLDEGDECLGKADRIIHVRAEAELKAKAEAERRARQEGRFPGDIREIEIAPGVKMAFVWVAPGSFRMGSDDSDADSDEKPVHEVTLTKGYWIGKFEVTQKEWRSVTGANPSMFKEEVVDAPGFLGFEKKTHLVDRPSCPVECVSWDDCQEFVDQVNDYLARHGEELRVRLPTEAEWEFAARGGTKSRGFKYSGSDNIDEVAWYSDNSGERTHEVGTKAANELGIHDMSGNIWEWCADWLGDYSSGSFTDPVGPGSGGIRVFRGGGCFNAARLCRSATRDRYWPDFRYYGVGVRLASGQ